MESSHKFSNVSGFSHKFGFDRTTLDYQQHNTPLVSIPQSIPPPQTTDISKEDNTKATTTARKKKTKK
jgi:hypothetical protein